MPSAAVEQFLARIEDRGGRVQRNGRSFMATCPAHEDDNPSLSVSQGDKGVIFHCHRGCSYEAIRDASGSKDSDLFEDSTSMPTTSPRQLVASYDYKDAGGSLVFQTLRYRLSNGKKDFKARRQDGKGWINNVKGVQLIPYRLPELTRAIARAVELGKQGPAVYVVEGEKCADAVAALGLIATTAPFGAGKWRPEFAEHFRGARGVYVLPDNDEPGREHARAVALSLHALNIPVKVVALPGLIEKGADVADWLAAGHTKAELEAVTQAAPRWEPTADQQQDSEAVTPAERDEGGGRANVVCLSDVQAERVEWLWPGRAPRGKLVLLDGDPDLGKTMIALDLAARISRGHSMPLETSGAEPANVLLLMAEDGVGDTIQPRLVAAGADLSRVFFFKGIPTPDGGERLPMLPDDGEAIRAEVERLQARALFLDPLFAYVSPDINAFRDQDVRRALHPLVKLGEDLDCTCVVLRHLNKAPGGRAISRGGGSIGIIGAARAGLLVAEDPDDNTRRVLAVLKCNLGPKAPAIAYRLVSEGDAARVSWESTTEHTPAQLLAVPASPEDVSALSEAVAFLAEALSSGPRPSADLIREGEGENIKRRTLWRAKDKLGVKSKKEGQPTGEKGKQRWVWFLPDPPAGAEVCQDTPKDAINFGWHTSASVGTLRGDEPAGQPAPVEVDPPKPAPFAAASVTVTQTEEVLE